MGTDYGSLVEALAIPHRAKDAFRRLMIAGPEARASVRAGLHHANADVRTYCCRYLDHFVDAGGWDELAAMLNDNDAEVRMTSLHALACDRCKDDSCRADAALVLPNAMALLRCDSDAHVRAMAVEVVGIYVHNNATAVAALTDAIASDPSPTVRKKAAWYAPGGPIYKRTAPKPVRAKRKATA